MKRWALVLLCAALAVFAQEEDEDEDGGIEIGDGEGGQKVDRSKDEKPGRTPEVVNPTSAPARVPGKRVKFVTFASRDGWHSCQVAEDWRLREVEAEGDQVLSCELRLPGVTGLAYFIVTRARDGVSPRSQVLLRKDPSDGTLERFYRPLPYVTDRRKDRVTALAFRETRGNVLVTMLQCRAESFDDAVRADFLKTVASLRSKLPFYPTLPDDYQRQEKAGFVFVAHPRVTASLKHVHKLVTKQAKRFAKFHGPLPKREDPWVVMIHNSLADAEKLLGRKSGGTNANFIDLNHGRLFLPPVHKGSRETDGLMTATIQGWLIHLAYGTTRPTWFVSGEQIVARAEVFTGKALPTLHAGFHGWIGALNLAPLSKLEELRKGGDDTLGKQSFFYVGMFRAGTSKYRKAYRTFLADYRADGDWDSAFRRHIEPLGYAAIQTATTEFMHYKLKSYLPK